LCCVVSAPRANHCLSFVTLVCEYPCMKLSDLAFFFLLSDTLSWIFNLPQLAALLPPLLPLRSSGHSNAKRKRHTPSLPRLIELCREAKRQGWQRVSQDTLVPSFDPSSAVCCFQPWFVAPNEVFTGERIFRRLMTDFVKCVVEESHHSFQSAHDGPRSCRLHTTSEEVWAFIAFLLRVMADNKPEERAFIRSQEFSDSKLLSQRKAEFLSTHLTRSYESMVRALNAGLRSILQVEPSRS